MVDINPIEMLMQDRGAREKRMAEQREDIRGARNLEINNLLNQLANQQTMREIAQKHANTRELTGMEHAHGMNLQGLKGRQSLEQIGATGRNERANTFLDKYQIPINPASVSNPGVDISNILQLERATRNYGDLAEALEALAGSKVEHQITAPTAITNIPLLPVVPGVPKNVQAEKAKVQTTDTAGDKTVETGARVNEEGRVVGVKKETSGERKSVQANNTPARTQAPVVTDEAARRTGTTTSVPDQAMIDNEMDYLAEKGFSRLQYAGQAADGSFMFEGLNPEGRYQRITIRRE